MAPLEITPSDMRPIDRDAHARLIKPQPLPVEVGSELKSILTELRLIKYSISNLIPRVRVALGAAVDARAEIKMSDILKLTAKDFGVTEADMLSARRTWNVVRPRQIAMYLCRNLTPRSYTEIGLFFRDRDHTTIMHAVNKVIQLMDQDRQLSQKIGLLADSLTKGEGNGCA